MDVERYQKRSELGLSSIEKEGDSVVLIEKRFDPETGKPVSPKKDYLDVKGFQLKKNQVSLELDRINTILEIISTSLEE